MSASLVGSEMCIRDSSSMALLRHRHAASEAPALSNSVSRPETPATVASVAALTASASRSERGRSEGRTGRGRI
eukprot:3237149-Alexandrium_andersonii.AAC.1